MVRKTKDGQIDFDKYWAQQIFLSQSGGKPHIFALVRRKYGPNDVESKGPGEYIGLNSEPIYEMETDTTPDSETYGQRVPKEITVYDQTGREIKQKVQTGTDMRPIFEATAATLKNFRSMVGHMPKPHGDTQFYWIFKEGKYSASDADEFFNTPLAKVQEVLVKRKTILDKKQKNEENEQE